VAARACGGGDRVGLELFSSFPCIICFAFIYIGCELVFIEYYIFIL
jgi:hypothetical protein